MSAWVTAGGKLMALRRRVVLSSEVWKCIDRPFQACAGRRGIEHGLRDGGRSRYSPRCAEGSRDGGQDDGGADMGHCGPRDAGTRKEPTRRTDGILARQSASAIEASGRR